MSDTYQRRRERHSWREPEPEQEDVEKTEFDEAENIRSGSQTAQDRDHTIRGGDNHTGPMKEFPT